MTEYAELFMKYNYPETKELCLKFLTLVISILVFSIAFSEKIIDFQNSSKSDKIILIFSWASFILAIILCGSGLTLHTLAGGQAVYKTNDLNIVFYSQKAYLLIIFAGTNFIIGLILLAASGVKFLFRTKKS